MKYAVAALLGVASASPANSSNPFLGKTIYSNPVFTGNVKKTETDNPSVAALLASTEQIGAANWIDSMAKISTIEPILQGAKANGHIPMFVIYDLPNRDCSALASNGEILCEDNSCAQGLNTYKTQYVDKVIEVFKKYPDVPAVAIIEPDSLPNLATNMSDQKCSQGASAYKAGVAYTLQQVAALGNVTSYLDVGHGGWLGWDNNLDLVWPIFSEVLQNAGGNSTIRGFVTNTANYQPLGSMSNTADPCNLKSQYNFAIDEVHFIDLLDKKFSQHGMSGMHYITDTSRNGVTNERRDCANWCNIQGAGLGRRPTTDVSDLGLNNLDALVWVKTPGESDGTSNTSAKRHDQHCNSQDSHIPSPEAGQWAEDFFVMLAQNANPPLTPGPSPTPPGPTPACPGGSLTACIGLCPSTPAAAFQACVTVCTQKCSSEVELI